MAVARSAHLSGPFGFQRGFRSVAVAPSAAVAIGKPGRAPRDDTGDAHMTTARESNVERLNALFSNSQAAIVEYVFREGEPIIEDVNPRFESVFGFERERVRGQSLDEYIVPPAGQDEADDLNEKVRNGEYLRAEVQRRTAEDVRTFIVRNAPIDTEGEDVRGYASYTDITERKERERDLQRQNKRLRALFANSQAAIVEYVFRDDEPVFVDVNARFEEIFGYDRGAVVGRSVDEFIVPQENQDVAADLNEKVKRGEYLHREVRRQTPEEVRTFVLRNAPIETEDGVRGYAAYTDISERKRRERQLEEQNERLEKFAKIVSHDLRNPLTVATGHVSMIDDERARTVEDNLDRMEAIIGDVLTLARDGTAVDETEPTDIAALARESWDQVATANATFASPDGLTVEADPGRCRQLFENLFRNSVEHAGTDVSIRMGPTDDGFYLEDDGPGIPPDVREEVFVAGFTTDRKGTGLGLNIVREIAQAHGWTVRITDGSDGGARFAFGECTLA